MYRLHLPRSGLHVIHAAAACALRERHRRKTAQQEPKRRAKSSQASVAVRRAVLLAWLQLSWRRPSDPAAAARFACAPSAGTRRAQSLRVRESRWREPTQPAPHRTAGAMMQRASIRARELQRGCAALATPLSRRACAQPSSVTPLAAWRRPVAAAQRRCITLCSCAALPVAALPSGTRAALCGERKSCRVLRRQKCCAAHRERRAAPAEAGTACSIRSLCSSCASRGQALWFCATPQP